MRKTIACIATSADGYIARSGGRVDWLDLPGMEGDYGMRSFYRSIDRIADEGAAKQREGVS